MNSMQAQSSIKIQHTIHPKILPTDESGLKFGRQFTDHMFVMNYDKAQQGWYSSEIIEYQSLKMDPAASGIHYGQAIFEGLKCYRNPQGKLQLFRPRDNFTRMNSSAARLIMPTFDIEFVLEALKTLLILDEKWVPHQRGTSLYIRPTMFATEPFLGVHPAQEFLFYIILSPVGPYYPNGFSPIQIYVENNFTRASEGGTGSIKNAGNYAAALMAANNAEAKGFTQVLWLDGREHRWIEEIGMMNVMFHIDDEFITPALDGCILPGITRDSILKILRFHGFKVSERRISINELITATENHTLDEAFGMGTAAVVAPIGSLTYQERCYNINQNQTGGGES
jgi:branched-chain amino acid aminotransferase